jgi:putative salt-induced outer membrane protein YdiY
MENMRMQTRILTVGLGALLFAACTVARAQDTKAGWHGDTAFGLSLARGNANTFLMNASATADRVWDQNELKLGADGQYGLNDFGQTNETRSAEAVHGFVDFKRLFSDRFYGDGRVDGSHDDLAEVRYRVIVGPAAGYYFIKSAATKLNLEVGPSFIKEKLGGENKSYVTLRVTERAERALNKASKIWEELDYYPQVDRFSNYLLNAEAGAEAALNTHFSLRVVADDKFSSKPAPGRKENDITLISSLVYKY